MITAVHVFSFLESGKIETNASLYNDLNICDAADFLPFSGMPLSSDIAVGRVLNWISQPQVSESALKRQFVSEDMI
jgi:hypothetical protein